MHKRAIEKGRFCPFHKKIEKLYPITVGTARASIARVCRLNADPPFDVDFVPYPHALLQSKLQAFT